MGTYRFHWKGSTTPAVVGSGNTPEEAFTLLGYGAGAAAALDYFERIDKDAVTKMSVEQFVQWEVEYWKRAESRHLRLGQAFMNQNYPQEVNSALYEETDPLVARRLILETYVDKLVKGEVYET